MNSALVMADSLRCTDLIAKVAGVNMRSTMRVVLAMDAICEVYGLDLESLLELCEFEAPRPSPDNVAACSHASFELVQESRTSQRMASTLGLIKALQ
jgi:hypothetical protein